MGKRVIAYSVMWFVPFIYLTPTHAEIFKCTNVKGKVYYNDRPCPKKDTEKEMRSEKDVKNGYAPPTFVKDIETKRKGVTVGTRSTKETLIGGEVESADAKSKKDKAKKTAQNENDSASGNASGSDVGGSSQQGQGGIDEQRTKHPTTKVDYSTMNYTDDDENKGKASIQSRTKIERKVLTAKERRQLLNIRIPHD